MTLTAEEFIRRFLLHVLPERFMRIRSFGFLANRYRAEKIERARQLLEEDPPATAEVMPDPASDSAHCLLLNDLQNRLCPECQRGHLVCVEVLRPALENVSVVEGIDSS